LPNCLLGPHGDCAHAFTDIEAPEGEHGLCQCECHASCPLAGTSPVSDADWRSSCTCRGAADAFRIAIRLNAIKVSDRRKRKLARRMAEAMARSR